MKNMECQCQCGYFHRPCNKPRVLRCVLYCCRRYTAEPAITIALGDAMNRHAGGGNRQKMVLPRKSNTDLLIKNPVDRSVCVCVSV